MRTRAVPAPASASPEASAILAAGRLGPLPREYPPLDDLEGWPAAMRLTMPVGD